AMGADAYVLHPLDTAFRCSWFEHRTRFLDNLNLDAQRDFIIIPEIWAPVFAPQCLRDQVHYAIFVQNGYLTHPAMPKYNPEIYDAAYSGADLILSISNDSTKMVLLNYPKLDPNHIIEVKYSVHERFSAPRIGAGAGRLITFMPRKMAGHAARVVMALGRHLREGWTIASIHGVDE
ncbi:hypothetical protein I3A86_26195, partial [Salmonella enterica]|nr:hypothetical protein [Salmonella enterica]